MQGYDENDAAGVRLGIYLHYKHRPEPGKVRLYNVVGVAQVSDNDAPGGLVVVYHGLQVEGHDAGPWWKTRKIGEFTGWVQPTTRAEEFTGDILTAHDRRSLWRDGYRPRYRWLGPTFHPDMVLEVV